MTYAEFSALFDQFLASEKLQEAEKLLEEYTRENQDIAGDTAFRAPVVYEGLAMDDGLQAEGLDVVGSVTRKARRLRNAKYARYVRNHPNGVRILEEGDSWHQYPVFIRDLVDQVSRTIPVHSLSMPGDLITDMAIHGEYVDAIRLHRPHILMLSGGGNDLLGAGRLIHLLRPFAAGATAQELIKAPQFEKAVKRVMKAYRHIVSTALQTKPDLHILMHGYDTPIPRTRGKWLGRPFQEKQIALDIGAEIVSILISRFNDELERFASQMGTGVYYVDLRGCVGSDVNSWADELHPKSAGFERCSDKMVEKIRDITASLNFESAPMAESEALNVSAKSLLSRQPVSLYDRLRLRASQSDVPPRNDMRPSLQDAAEMAQAHRDLDRLIDEFDVPESEERVKNRLDYSINRGRHSYEAIIGENNFDEYYVLPRGARVGKAVARVHARGAGGGSSYGTGFLIGGGLMMTNNHVLRSRQEAAGSLLTFNYQFNEDGTPGNATHFRITDEVFVTSTELDYTIASVASVSTEGDALESFGFIELLPNSGKALKKEFVNIIQHPRGEYKKVALRENLVVGRSGTFLYYVTDTLPGSSGSPVLNEEWQLAAIHHMALRDQDNPDQYRANRGVRISSILEDLDQKSAHGYSDATKVTHRLERLRTQLPAVPPYGVEGQPSYTSERASASETACTATAHDPEDDEQDWSEGLDDIGEDPAQALVFEAGRPHLPASAAQWPSSSRNAPDTWHLPADFGDATFALNDTLLRSIANENAFEPQAGPGHNVIFGLRGCRISDGSDFVESLAEVELRTATVDHENFRCVMGVWDRNNGVVSVYSASTVPRRTEMKRYYDFRNFGTAHVLANMLPTGCYEYCVGTHQSKKRGAVKYVLRQGHGPDPEHRSTVTTLRTHNDLIYGTLDFWDKARPADNIHPAFLGHSFSSQGCLTLPGTQDGHGASTNTGTGLWRKFRQKAGFDGEHYRARFDLMLVTGHEAAAFAGVQDVSALACLRHGSRGQAVIRLQNHLGVTPDGEFGPATKKRLTEVQRGQLGFATGSYGPKMADELSWAY